MHLKILAMSGLVALTACSENDSLHPPSDGGQGAGTVSGGGYGGAGADGPGAAGWGGCYSGGGGCIDYGCYPLSDEPEAPADCMLADRWDVYCGAEEHAEAWTVTDSTCATVPDGYYVATGRTSPSINCPGWDACAMGAFSEVVGKSLSDADWQWVVGGCDLPSCHGLPFFIADANHTTADASCLLQCTAGPPDGTGKAAATCTDGNAPCTLDYRWTDQP